jgi:hypothetical protein
MFLGRQPTSALDAPDSLGNGHNGRSTRRQASTLLVGGLLPCCALRRQFVVLEELKNPKHPFALIDELVSALDAVKREGDDPLLDLPLFVVRIGHGARCSDRASCERHVSIMERPQPGFPGDGEAGSILAPGTITGAGHTQPPRRC